MYLVPGGILSLGGVPSPGGGIVCPGGCLPRGRACLPGGGAQGVSAWGGVSQTHTSLLCTEFLTHAYENITLPQTSFAGGNKT